MRILLLSDEPREPSMGGPKVALKLQAAFAERGHACDVLFRDDLGPRPRAARLRLALAPLLARRAARRAQHPSGYDVIDASSAEGWLLPRGPAAPAIIARSHGLEHRYYRELLADAHAGLLHKPWSHRIFYPAVRLPQVAAALRRADQVLALNHADRDFILARGWQTPSRVVVMPHGVSRSWLDTAPPAGAPRGGGILFCGWWTSNKGASYLAQAHARLLARGIPAPLTLLGVGAPESESPAAMEARVRAGFEPASQPWLRILPRTRDEAAVFAAYRQHDLLVCPSTSEGFGLVVIEALSQRLPVVASATVGAADLLADGREARLVPPRDPEALAMALAQLLRDAALRQRLGEAGHRLAATLTWPTVAARTLEVYRAALASRGHNSSHAAHAAGAGIRDAPLG